MGKGLSIFMPMNLPTLTAPAKIKNHFGDFASALAHEVRNPLTNINLAHTMLEKSIHDEEQKQYLDIIIRSSIRINQLIIDLFNCQHEEEKQLGFYSIHKLLDDALEKADDRIRMKGILVTKEYTAIDYPLALNGPEIKLALLNIIINGIDAMTSGIKELRLVTKTIDDRIILQIEDNGCGMSEENLRNIFRPYFSLKAGGLGIGLTTTHNILRANHIKVKVESKKGEGTKFILIFQKKLRDLSIILSQLQTS